jgi:hypothetical protein
MKFKRRHGEFEQGCVMSQSYTATDALPPILPACCRLACWLLETPFVTRDIFLSEDLFVNWFVRDERRSWTEVPLYYKRMLLPACVFVTWDTVCYPRHFSFRRFVHDERRSWTEVPLYYKRMLMILLFSFQMTMLSATTFLEEERNMDCCHCSTMLKILFFHNAVKNLSEYHHNCQRICRKPVVSMKNIISLILDHITDWT